MSGHSKWATIKRKKGALDKARGKAFAKLARQLAVAAREGGGDPNSNASLRTVVLKAKAAQMTNDAIDRAIKRGSGVQTGASYESITYEAYAPGGVAMLIECLTDNRNRTASDVRSLFSKFGGAMAEPGAVGWQFSRQGIVNVSREASEDAVMTAALDAGVDDIVDEGDSWRILCDPSAVFDVKTALEDAGIAVNSATTTMLSSMSVQVQDAADARAVLRIMDELEENDDVQDVYANFDISDDLMAEAAS
ncbi:MAG: YebC/PmpR family DNA-binding transcriptional regulator [Ilumatobacteraceae bacterium]